MTSWDTMKTQQLKKFSDREKKLNCIFSADDFGKNALTNRNVIKLARKRRIDRVSVMMLGKWDTEHIQELLHLPVLLDIHLELPRLLKSKRHRRQKVLLRALNFLFSIISGKYTDKTVRRAWEEQIEKFRLTFGRYPDGLNTHEHVHFYPRYFRILLELARKHSVSFVRFGSKGIITKNSLISFILRILRMINLKAFRRSGTISSDWMISLDWNKKFEDLRKISRGNDTIDVICHPERKSEFEFLKSDFVKKIRKTH